MKCAFLLVVLICFFTNSAFACLRVGWSLKSKACEVDLPMPFKTALLGYKDKCALSEDDINQLSEILTNYVERQGGKIIEESDAEYEKGRGQSQNYPQCSRWGVSIRRYGRWTVESGGSCFWDERGEGCICVEC